MSTDTLGGNTQSNVHSLFENKPSSESNQHGGQKPIVIAHGIKPDKNFHVSTDDVELRSVLEGSGGRYIKKYKAYRFPKKSEERVRAKIAVFLDSTDPVDHYLDDQIRTEATLEIGQTYRAGINGDQWILREFIPEIGEKGLRVKFQKYSPEYDSVLQSFSTINLDYIGSQMSITPTNAHELYEHFIGSKYRTVDSFSKPSDFREFLLDGGVAQFDEVELFVQYMPGRGTYAIISRPLGKQREAERTFPKSPSVWTQKEAVDILLRNHLPTNFDPTTFEKSGDESTKEEPQRFHLEDGRPNDLLLVRGQVVSLIGKNSKGDYLYENQDGIRTAITLDQRIVSEVPDVSDDLTFKVSPNRKDQFKLVTEHSQEFTSPNVTALFRNSTVEENQQDESIDVEEYMKNMGLDIELMRGAISKRILLIKSNTTANQFIINRREKEADQAYKMMVDQYSEAGFSLNPEGFEQLVLTFPQKLKP